MTDRDAASPAAHPHLRRWTRALSASHQFWAGFGIVAAYAGLAIAALLHFGSTIDSWVAIPQLRGMSVSPGPSMTYPLGTLPILGVDLADALWRATPWDVGLLLAILGGASVVGILAGGYAGLREGGVADFVIVGTTDVLAGVPPFILIIVIFVNLQEAIRADEFLPIFALVCVLVLFPTYARTVRARARQVAQAPYVEAAIAGGARRSRLLRRHILPNSFAPALAQLPVDYATVFFVLTIFPFLRCFSGSLLGPGEYGLVTPLPTDSFPEWGRLLALGTCYGFGITPGSNYWWTYTVPAATIVALGLGLGLLCDGLHRIIERAPTPA